MAKNYWKSKAGKAAIRQAGVTDAAGAMRVGPAGTLGGGLGSGRAGPFGVNTNAAQRALSSFQSKQAAAAAPTTTATRSGPFDVTTPATRQAMTNYQNKQIKQGPSTGFGSFKNTTEPMPRENKELF